MGVTWNFNDTAAWSGGVVPPDSSTIYIVDAKMNLDLDNRVFGVVSVGNGLYIGLGSKLPSLITDYLNNVGTLSASSSTIIFNSTVADNNSGQPTCDGTSAITLNDVQIPSGAVVDFGSGDIGAEPNTETTVTGTLSLDGGAVVLYAPFYGGASTLKYNDSYTVSTRVDATKMFGSDERGSYQR